MTRHNKNPSLSDVANKLSWQRMLGLATVFFITFFWAFPAVFTIIISSFKNNTANPTQNASTQQFASGMNSLIEHLLSLFFLGLKGVGVILAFVCVLFAIRNYFRNGRT